MFSLKRTAGFAFSLACLSLPYLANAAVNAALYDFPHIYVFDYTVPTEKLTPAIDLLTQSGLINIDKATYMLTPATPDVDLLDKSVGDIAALVFNKTESQLTRITEDEIKQTQEAMETLLIDVHHPYGSDEHIRQTILIRVETATKFAEIEANIKEKIINHHVSPEHNKPTISGLDPVTIIAGTPFDLLAGVTAYDEVDGDITYKLRTGGYFDPNRAGHYHPWYYVEDSEGYSTTRFRSILVTNTAPVISGATDVTIAIGTVFDLREGVTAMDKEDGDITANIQITGSLNTQKTGNYRIKYSVTDSGGRTTSVHRTIRVENAKPVFHGVEDAVIMKGSEFDPMAGVTAIDPEEGDITDRVQVIGYVNPNRVGHYRLVYSVKDSHSYISVTAIRHIAVVNAP